MLAVSDEPAGATPFADVSRSVLVWGAAGGTALGIAYAASPLSVWFLAAMIGLFAWAGRGLTERERRWALGVLAVAVVLRVMLISGLFLTSDHGQFVSFFWDGDGLALKRRSVSIRNVWLDIPISPFFFAVAFDRLYGWTTYLYVLAYIQYWLGPAPYAIHLLNVTLFLVSAVALYRVVRSSFGRTSALLGLVILLFLPTPFLWSVSALKESLYVFLLVLCLIAAVKVVRGRFLTRVFALVVLVVSILAIDGIRQGAQFIATAGVGAGLVGSVVVRRVSTVLLVLLLLPFAAHRAWQDPGIQSRTMSRLQVAAVRHIGNVRTEGHGYKLLDQRAYTDVNSDASTWITTSAEAGRFVARALVAFVVVPLPWQVQSASEVAILPQQAVWYALVVFAGVGLIVGLRRDALVTCLLAGLATAGAAAVALNSGNIGTMVRHRDTIVPFVVWLSALGVVATVSRVLSRGASDGWVRRDVTRGTTANKTSGLLAGRGIDSSIVARAVRRVAQGSAVCAAVLASCQWVRRSRERIVEGLGGGWSDAQEVRTAERLGGWAANSRLVATLWSLITAPSAAWRETRLRRLLDSFLSRDLPTRVRVVGCSMIAAALTHAVMLALLGFSVHGVGWSIRLGFVVGGFVVALWPTALALAWRDRIGAS